MIHPPPRKSGGKFHPQNPGSFARGRCRRGRSEIPHFCSKFCCCLPLSFKRRREKRRKTKKRKTKKMQKKKKTKKCVKKGENHSDPIYTNPIKNLPNLNARNQKCPFPGFSPSFCSFLRVRGRCENPCQSPDTHP